MADMRLATLERRLTILEAEVRTAIRAGSSPRRRAARDVSRACAHRWLASCPVACVWVGRSDAKGGSCDFHCAVHGNESKRQSTIGGDGEQQQNRIGNGFF